MEVVPELPASPDMTTEVALVFCLSGYDHCSRPWTPCLSSYDRSGHPRVLQSGRLPISGHQLHLLCCGGLLLCRGDLLWWSFAPPWGYSVPSFLLWWTSAPPPGLCHICSQFWDFCVSSCLECVSSLHVKPVCISVKFAAHVDGSIPCALSVPFVFVFCLYLFLQ